MASKKVVIKRVTVTSQEFRAVSISSVSTDRKYYPTGGYVTIVDGVVRCGPYVTRIDAVNHMIWLNQNKPSWCR